MDDFPRYALRLPPDIKAAAEALKVVRLHRPSRAAGETGVLYTADTTTLSEALVYLMNEGMGPVLGRVQAALDEAIEGHAQFEEIMKFFLETPIADRARAQDFAAGSKARAYIEAGDACDDDEAEEGYSRAEIAQEHGWSQTKVLDLTAAKGAIQKALRRLEERDQMRADERAAHRAPQRRPEPAL